jgi:tRNA-specific 2-thiouridylase
MKIAVAVSGGIDSMVTAHLLKSSGNDIFAIHFLTGFESVDNHENFLSPHCQKLGVKLITVNLSPHFQSEVVNYFISTYAKGKTPNPCVICNAKIKFGYLWAYARKLGAEKIATGHYARVAYFETRYLLKKGIDHKKDQSYFLALLSNKQLASAIFPLGTWNKENVINYAQEKGIDKPVQPESQEVCFIRDRYQDFLIHSGCIKKNAGPIITTSGKEIGYHNGLHAFTIGQRRGINCPGPYPYYVVRLEQHSNTLVVGKKEDLLSESCIVHEINWIVVPPQFAIDIDVRIRYRTKAVKARLTPIHLKQALLNFETKQSAVTPGQIAVFYKKNNVFGGGMIQSVS